MHSFIDFDIPFQRLLNKVSLAHFCYIYYLTILIFIIVIKDTIKKYSIYENTFNNFIKRKIFQTSHS